MDYQTDKGMKQANAPHAFLEAPESNLSKLLREYKDAKELFDEACLDADNGINRRSHAAEVLQKLTSEVVNTVQNGLHDPTQAMAATSGAPQRIR